MWPMSRTASDTSRLTALGAGHRDDPCVTADETGSEKAGVMVEATQQALPCDAEA